MSELLPITVENIELQHNIVISSTDYGGERKLLSDVFRKFPENTDINIVAMKISLIDLTNSTHLSQYKSRINLYDLSKLIVGISDFDLRLSQGDPEIVNIIAKNTGAINLFSFATKYCTNHNMIVYGRDDYSIFDSVVKTTLPKYKSTLSAHRIDTWRTTYNYQEFSNCIRDILDEHEIHIPFRRRKFDHFLWYSNK